MKMTPHDRLTFELVEAGLVSETRRPLYEPAISRLVEAGIIRLDGELYAPTDADRVGRRADGSSRLTPHGPPKPPPMGQMQVRIPQPWIDAMIARAGEAGVDKSKILRDLLRPHFEADAAAEEPAPARTRPAGRSAVRPAAKPSKNTAKRRRAS